MPCEGGTGTFQHSDLIFYFNQDWGKRPMLIPHLKRMIQDSKAKKCFRKVKFLMANLQAQSEQDKYPLGSSLMFFRAMELPILVDEYRYMYWMEADQQPCKPGWLDRVYNKAIFNPGFWMIGSIMRDGQSSSTYYSFADHLNGNSLYRLDDPGFHSFLSKVQEEFSKNKGRFLAAFDIAIYLVARHTLSFTDYTNIKHRFIYTDLLQNVYRTPTNITQLCQTYQTTFLVHGKYLSY